MHRQIKLSLCARRNATSLASDEFTRCTPTWRFLTRSTRLKRASCPETLHPRDAKSLVARATAKIKMDIFCCATLFPQRLFPLWNCFRFVKVFRRFFSRYIELEFFSNRVDIIFMEIFEIRINFEMVLGIFCFRTLNYEF